jgi:hypothetical protein
VRIGITGHQTLRSAFGWDWVDASLRSVLAEYCPLCVGVTSLAVGADQRFASIVLDLGGAIEVIVPFPEYEHRFGNERDRLAYRAFLEAAQFVLTLPRLEGRDESSYLAAGKRVVDESELLLAVWDGKPAGGLGGTADIVGYAESLGKKLVHINPLTGRAEKRSW